MGRPDYASHNNLKSYDAEQFASYWLAGTAESDFSSTRGN